MFWDLFCHVIDNQGDAGVCWRLAADLARRGEQVRLWIDDPTALAWMAPDGMAGVEVKVWVGDAAWEPGLLPGEVVVESFGCEPPPAFVAAMAAASRPPVWINLEYLSAQDYVEASHGLRSPQFSGPGAGLTKWFFYPGFGDRTGGLLREPGLVERRASFDRRAWLAARGIETGQGERIVALFCYDNPALVRLIADLAVLPTLVLACPGPAQRQLSALALPPTVRCIDLPWLSHADFDLLLWSADFNLVRGEDSFVRAIWAARPFLWQIYPQNDGAHAAKLDAWLSLFGPHMVWPDRHAWCQLQRAWNGLAPWPSAWPDADAWRDAGQRWCQRWSRMPDLTSQLLAFVAEKR